MSAIKGIKSGVEKAVNAAAGAVAGQEPHLTGSDQYHFLFAGKIGQDKTDYNFKQAESLTDE